MKIGILSDAHGNPHGLAPCLAHLAKSGADQVVFLGDAVGYFPQVDAVLDLLDQARARLLLGNHEAMLLGLRPLDERRDSVYRLGSARARLGPRRLELLASLEPRWEVELDGRRLLFVHGSPEDPLEGRIYPDTPIDSLADLEAHSVFMGHTHYPFVRRAGPVQVVNVGSCGLPRDRGDLASCAVFDTRTGRCEIERIRFHVPTATRAEVHPDVVACLDRRPTATPFGSLPGEDA